jgi:hypothetical protein
MLLTFTSSHHFSVAIREKDSPLNNTKQDRHQGGDCNRELHPATEIFLQLMKVTLFLNSICPFEKIGAVSAVMTRWDQKGCLETLADAFEDAISRASGNERRN